MYELVIEEVVDAKMMTHRSVLPCLRRILLLHRNDDSAALLLTSYSFGSGSYLRFVVENRRSPVPVPRTMVCITVAVFPSATETSHSAWPWRCGY